MKENLNFCIAENTFVDINIDALNDVLRINKHTQVSKDDDSEEISVKDYDGYDDDEIKDCDGST